MADSPAEFGSALVVRHKSLRTSRPRLPVDTNFEPTHREYCGCGSGCRPVPAAKSLKDFERRFEVIPRVPLCLATRPYG